MQLCILFIGVLVYVFYVFQPAPLNFQRLDQARLESPALGAAYQPIKTRYDAAFDARRSAAERLVAGGSAGETAAASRAFGDAQHDLESARRDAAALAASSGGSGASGATYFFLPSFVAEQLPSGVVGVVVAVIFATTMTAMSAEMSAPAAVSVDVYRRHVHRDGSDHHYLRA